MAANWRCGGRGTRHSVLVPASRSGGAQRIKTHLFAQGSARHHRGVCMLQLFTAGLLCQAAAKRQGAPPMPWGGCQRGVCLWQVAAAV